MSRPLFSIFVAAAYAYALAPTPSAAAEDGTSAITGTVVDESSGERLANALVVLMCTCLAGQRETTTDERGLYAFRKLPPGTYTIQVLAGEADVSKVTMLPASKTFRADFRIDPHQEIKRAVSVKPAYRLSGASYTLADGMRDISNAVSEPVPQRESAKQRLVEHRKDAVALRNAGAAANHGPEARDVPAAELPAVENDKATTSLPDDFARQVVYSGAMDVSVFNLRKTKERVEKIVVDAGGWVQSLRGNGMLLRIPATEFRSVAAAIGELGRVERQEFEALDVTEDYYDLQTRIEVLRRTQTQLLELLDKSRTVTQALEVRRELDKVTLELESALGRERVLASQVRFSALSLALGERVPQVDTPSTNDPFPWVDEIGVEGTAWR